MSDPLVQIRLSDLLALRAAASAPLAPALPAVDPTPPAPPTVPPAAFLTTAEAAALLGVSRKGLEAMRARGGGPPFVRVGKAVRYARADLQLRST